MGAPTCLHKWGGEPNRNAAQPAQGYVNDDLKADGLQKGWGFQVGTWNVDSLAGTELFIRIKLVWSYLHSDWDEGHMEEQNWRGTK